MTFNQMTKCNKCGSTEMEGMWYCTPMRFADKVGDAWAMCSACQKEENDLPLPDTNYALFALTGEEQIVSLLKKVVENQERDNERQDRRDSALAEFLAGGFTRDFKELKR